MLARLGESGVLAAGAAGWGSHYGGGCKAPPGIEHRAAFGSGRPVSGCPYEPEGHRGSVSEVSCAHVHCNSNDDGQGTAPT